MLPHWDSVIEPLLAALDNGPIVEVGAGAGETTRRLADFAAQRNLVLESIEPEPQFDVEAMERRFGHSFRLHRHRSHDALERIEPPAAAIVDGDHNWYTVYGELTRLGIAAARARQPFPLTILHDVEWPYGRRDMYYEPDAIPGAWRRPWARRGIRWGQRRLDETGRGINAHLANAVEEGGPRNGVLTAIEDFLDDSAARLELRIVPGEAGLGALADAELLEARPALQEAWNRLRSAEFLAEHAERLARVASRAIAARLELSHQTPPQGKSGG